MAIISSKTGKTHYSFTSFSTPYFFGQKMSTAEIAPGRTSYAVCAGVTRPSADDKMVVRCAIGEWPIDEGRRVAVKRILNISDCRMGVADGAILAEAPGDKKVVVIDIDNDYDDWASIPWG